MEIYRDSTTSKPNSKGSQEQAPEKIRLGQWFIKEKPKTDCRGGIS